MIIDTKYMHRCIQLASKGKGYTSPNPLVGAVIVYNDTIIGEGYHRKYGNPHAEVNAIGSVEQKSLLDKSTLYVSLEPCSHFGKTPPCSQLIIDSKIPNVVIGTLDPFPLVSGRGVKMLEEVGIKIKVGILEKECQELNKEFNTAHTQNRPFVYLKWAQSKDGFIDKVRTASNTESTPISNDFTRMLVHKFRAETDAILIATNTAIADNPSLTTRYWFGKNQTRVILDRTLRIPKSAKVHDDSAKTLIITESNDLPTNTKNTEYFHIPYDSSFLQNLYLLLKEKQILSLLIEGGSKFLQSVINSNQWDEAYIETANIEFEEGIKAPTIEGKTVSEKYWNNSKHVHLERILI